jgi:hypothetical protein
MNVKTVERALCNKLKDILDKNANFVKPLSEFWKGCTREQCSLVGYYGLWLSGEGSSQIDGEYVLDYYADKVHDKLQKFMDENNLHVEWYDCGTPVILFDGEYQ